jgi:hypothetical protein
MKNVKTLILNQPKVRVVKNTDRNDRDQWAKIVVNGIVKHTGQPKYIKGIAKKKYNLLAKF